MPTYAVTLTLSNDDAARLETVVGKDIAAAATTQVTNWAEALVRGVLTQEAEAFGQEKVQEYLDASEADRLVLKGEKA